VTINFDLWPRLLNLTLEDGAEIFLLTYYAHHLQLHHLYSQLNLHVSWIPHAPYCCYLREGPASQTTAWGFSVYIVSFFAGFLLWHIQCLIVLVYFCTVSVSMDCVDEKLIELATEGRISCACAMKFWILFLLCSSDKKFILWPFVIKRLSYSQSLCQFVWHDMLCLNIGLVAWHSGRTPVSGRRTFPVLRLTGSWWWPLMWVSHPLQVSQLGQLSLSSFRGR